MTAVDLDALDAARAAATAGPWAQDGTMILGTDEVEIVDCWETSADAALIVAAVNALPDLIAEARKARALREAVEEWHRLGPYTPTAADSWQRDGLRRAASRLRAALAAVDGGAA